MPGVRPRCQLSQYPLRAKSCEYVDLISCAALVVAGPSSVLYVCVPHRPADPSLRGMVRAGSLCSNSGGRCVSRPAREMRKTGVASCAAYIRSSMRWGITGYACMWRGEGFEGEGAGVGGLGALIRTANQFQNSDFPTPRGYEQAVHPPFN